jgi:CHAD domain-containing protein
MLKLGAWLSAEPWLDAEGHGTSAVAESRARVPVMKFAERLLAHHHRQLKKYGRKLEDLDAPRLHALRIITKKQRYAAEFFAGLYPQKETKRYIQSLSDLQEVLGVINDVAVIERLLAELCLKENQSDEHEAAGIIRGWSASMASVKKHDLNRAWTVFSKHSTFW